MTVEKSVNMKNYHIKMTNDPSQKITMEQVTKKSDQKVSLTVSKNVLAQLKRRAGIVGKASPSMIVKAFITTELNLNNE